ATYKAILIVNLNYHSMNFDYTELIKNTYNDNVCFNYLEHVGSYPEGKEKFILKGVKNIDIFTNEKTSEIVLKANFPYYIQGHNFRFTKADMIEAIQLSSEYLNLNLFQAEMKKFEFGSIIELEYNVDEFLMNHISIKGKNTQPFYTNNKLTGKYFEDSIIKHKLYNVGVNLKSKLDKAIRDDLSNKYGYDKAKHYLKIENHYKKPEIHFKHRNLFVNEVLNDNFMTKCKLDLINTYKTIMKTGIVKLPTNKKDLNAGTIPLIVLKELESIFDFNTEELIQKKINSIPESLLTKGDKKARQSIMKTNFSKIKKANESHYDITSKLEEAKCS
ncbi:MAG: hypothetical protein NTU43_01930, partial [Bacteroidetes bacterium]|nr:hypothetical protein [Bacteroidota bacterium]